MKKKQLIIAGIILLLSLLLPISQAIFTLILGTMLLGSIIFLLVTTIKKKLFYPAPKIFTAFLFITIGLELHFTKNLIFGWDYIVFGNLVAKLNYIIGIVIIGLLALFNIFFIAHFIYKEAISLDPVKDMNKELVEIDSNPSLTSEQQSIYKQNAMKKADFYSHLQLDQKKLITLSLSTTILGIIQIIICFFKKYIILEPTVGNVVGFNFIIIVIISLLSFTMYNAAKKY